MRLSPGTVPPCGNRQAWDPRLLVARGALNLVLRLRSEGGGQGECQVWGFRLYLRVGESSQGMMGREEVTVLKDYSGDNKENGLDVDLGE